MNGRVVVEVVDSRAAVFVRNMEPYDVIRVLISTVLALLEGTAEVTFNEGPLTEQEEQEIINSLGDGSVPIKTTGGQRDN